MKKPRIHSSEVLINLTKQEKVDNFTYADLVRHLKKRAFGVAFLIFALPSALPFSMIPGISTIFSIPILFFAGQMILGKKTLWLPKFIANRPIPQKKLFQVIHKTAPYLKKIERLLQPRLEFMSSTVAESITGIFIAILSILLMLPIPLSNFFISGILILFALAISEDDGLLILIAWLATIILLVLINTFIIGIIKAITG